MKLVFVFTKNDREVTRFETKENFVEELLVQVSDSLGLTRPTVEESANTLDGLRLRRCRRLTEEQTRAVLDSPSLTDGQKDLLHLLTNGCIKTFGCSFQNNSILNSLLSFDCERLSNLRERVENITALNPEFVNVYIVDDI